MKLDHLQSLTEDELAILWFCINKINPPVLSGFELEPSLFVAIKHKKPAMKENVKARRAMALLIKKESHKSFEKNNEF